MPYVYRVEDLDGRGPYRGRYVGPMLEPLGFSSFTTDHQPTPNRDPLLRDRWGDIQWSGQERNWKFGFTSMKQAREWFYRKPWRKKLVELGFKLVKYWVSAKDYVRGKYQAIFKKRKAKQVAIFWDF